MDGGSNVKLGCQDAGFSLEWRDGLVSHGPEAPKHGRAEDKTSAGAVKHHVCFPFVLHVTSACNLEEPEYGPEEEEDETMGK